MASLAPLALSARHEARLAWRDFWAMMTAGQSIRSPLIAIAFIVIALLMHLLAFALIGPWAARGIAADAATLVPVTGIGLLLWTVMLSQALESTTRAYYARSDLDLYLSSPASPRLLFVVRTTAIAGQTVTLSALLASPLINMLVVLDGPRWLAAYGVLAVLAVLAVAVAIVLTQGLFALIGARRTRLAAQILAAVIGAGFAIGVQAAAIVALGEVSRFALFSSASLIDAAPSPESLLWLPARAAMGDGGALALLVVLAAASFAAVCALASRDFARLAVAAAGLSTSRVRQQRARRFRDASAKATLRIKEWRLLARDPWLVSQTLMQVLYLIPPGLLLWLNFGDSAGVMVVVVPILVMATGQLAGGLAWLTISGEDAHDFVVTAPLPAHAILSAKVESVLGLIAIVLAPFLLVLLIADPRAALATAIGGALAAGSATAIQLWFRSPMRRAMFRRRQVASRAATIFEAFASILWAGTAALAVAGGWLAVVALVPALLATGALALAYALSPARTGTR